MTQDHATNMTQSELEKWRLETGDDAIEAMRQACADDCASLERQLEDKDVEIERLLRLTRAQTAIIDRWQVDRPRVEECEALRAEVERQSQARVVCEGQLEDRDTTIAVLHNDIESLRTFHDRLKSIAKENYATYENELFALRAEMERLKTYEETAKEFEVWSEDQRSKLRERIAALEGALEAIIKAEHYPAIDSIARAALGHKP